MSQPSSASSPTHPDRTLAVITGASRGIGAGIAAAARSAGATVLRCNRTETDSPSDLICDLSEPASWPRFASWLDAAVDEHHPEQLLVVHNAATLSPIGFAGEVDPAGYTANVLLNSAAPQLLGDAVIRTANRTGTRTVLVQLSSGAGKAGYPGWSSYCGGKAAVDRWVEAVGLEQAQRGDLVRVLSISPGVVATDMQAEIRSTAADSFPNVQRFKELHDDGNLADPGEVGAAIWSLGLDGDWPNGAILDLRDR